MVRRLSEREIVERFCEDLCKELSWLEAELLEIEDIGEERTSAGTFRGYKYRVSLRYYISILHLRPFVSSINKIIRKYRRYGAVIDLDEQKISCSYLETSGILLSGTVWFRQSMLAKLIR